MLLHCTAGRTSIFKHTHSIVEKLWSSHSLWHHLWVKSECLLIKNIPKYIGITQLIHCTYCLQPHLQAGTLNVGDAEQSFPLLVTVFSRILVPLFYLLWQHAITHQALLEIYSKGNSLISHILVLQTVYKLLHVMFFPVQFPIKPTVGAQCIDDLCSTI